MFTLPFIAFVTILTGLIGATIHFVRESIARAKLAAQYPHRRYDPEEPVGELKFCDDYHAGMFYW